ncbi:GNAT family N-acetyltransferase [Galactobacter valiniphilus]|uniref:GNAT family N-acetyltransferase n=1 Tax=Galactobacter valiniphilus TaxID=2676122 RepID=A0A399JCG6_9MICC|nr:GNAT family N-acetyltransferase [Galactobacter valiniphilus]RII42247.1 GNAT family N-acetyltransferase [Galactobacter valiniphilus]
MIDKSQLLAEYDRHLRAGVEMAGTASVDRLGPLYLGVYGTPGEEQTGFVSYAGLGVDPEHPDTPADRARVDEVVRRIVAWRDARPELSEVEVKTRAHDRAEGLSEALAAAGFEPEEPESVMIGPLEGLVGTPAPEGITIAPALTEEAMWAAARMEDEVFGSTFAQRIVPELLRRRAAGEPVTLWSAIADGRVVSAGRIEPVAGTPFAGVWGGATLPEYRGRGIYRALTSARAASVAGLGVRLIHSDSTEDSRPILERAGLIKVTETTPFVWRRGGTA